MENSIKFLIALGLSYGLVYWAITNPASAESIVNKVDSAITSSVDFISETFFDSEKEGV
jgi:hypothetical protein